MLYHVTLLYIAFYYYVIYILSYVVLFIMVCHIILYCVILLCHIVVYHIVQHTLYIIERVLEFCFFPAQKFATKSAMRRSWRQKPQWWKWITRLPAFPSNSKVNGITNFRWIFSGEVFSTWNDRWTKTKKRHLPTNRSRVCWEIPAQQWFILGVFASAHLWGLSKILLEGGGSSNDQSLTKGWISAMIQTVKNSSGGLYAQWVKTWVLPDPGFCRIFFIQNQSVTEIFKSLPQNMVVSCDLRSSFFFPQKFQVFPDPFEVGILHPRQFNGFADGN